MPEPCSERSPQTNSSREVHESVLCPSFEEDAVKAHGKMLQQQFAKRTGALHHRRIRIDFFVIDRYNSEYKKNYGKRVFTGEIAASARTKELQRAMAFCSATPGLERVPHAKSC